MNNTRKTCRFRRFSILSIKVVAISYKSVQAAYQAFQEDIGFSITPVYTRRNGIEPRTSAERVSYTTDKMEPIIMKLGDSVRSPLPGKRFKRLYGNCIEKRQHRQMIQMGSPLECNVMQNSLRYVLSH